MHEEQSRQDRFRSLITHFSDKGTTSGSLSLVLYPGELIRFKKEFPELNFSEKCIYKTATSKKYRVVITKI